MADTLTTGIAGLLRTIVKPELLKAYARKRIVAFPATYVEEIAGQGGKTIQIGIPTKDSAAAVAEADDITPTANAWSGSTTVTVSEVGIARNVSKMSRRSNILGDFGYMQWLIEDGGILCWEKIETDIWAQFANASTSVGTSGAAFTVANFVAGLSQHDTNESSGRVVWFLGNKQVGDFRESLTTSTATILSGGAAGEVLERTREDGYVGTFLGCQTWTSTCRATANAGADEVGACMVVGAERPEQSATQMAVLWYPEPAELGDPSARKFELAVTCCYGLGEAVDRSYVKGVTRAS